MSSNLRDVSIELLAADPVRGLDPAAFDNFQKVVAVRPDDQVLLLIDRTLDPRVVEFLWGFARGRGAQVSAIAVERAGAVDFPAEAKPMIEAATLVLSTWFTTSIDDYFFRLRREKGQRYVKLTYFRSLDLMRSEAARFPVELISMLIRKTAAAYPSSGGAVVRITDPRGTDLRVQLEQTIIDNLMKQSRWRGEMSADKPGAYVHWLPTHGPNFWDFTACDEFFTDVAGVVRPQMSVGFPDPFTNGVEIEVVANEVVAVHGDGADAADLREVVLGGNIIELGCGFNPKHPRNQTYPAGSNSAGAIHVGLDITGAADLIDRRMPDWPEPPEHVDMVLLDATVTVNDVPVVTDGRLCALRDPEVRAAASRYGSPAYLLEEWPTV